jgi:SNF2 family DNA or RNA helicase
VAVIELKPHQASLLEQFKVDERPLLLAGCVGSGKTLTALLLDHERRQHKPRPNPSLIICPASVKFNWANEVHKWLNLPAIVVD